MFGRDDGEPFPANTVSQRAKRTWKNAGLDPITMHEARHTAASYLIASGANLKAVSVFVTPTSRSPSTAMAGCCRAPRMSYWTCSTPTSKPSSKQGEDAARAGQAPATIGG